MIDQVEVPEMLRQMADSLGVNVDELAARFGGGQKVDDTPPIPVSAQSAAPVAGVEIAEGVTARPAETPLEQAQRELAVSQQELQQTRKLAETAAANRVAGSGGQMGLQPISPPDLAGVEPGLRWAVRNGLVDVEKIADPLIRDLFKADMGGVI